MTLSVTSGNPSFSGEEELKEMSQNPQRVTRLASVDLDKDEPSHLTRKLKLGLFAMFLVVGAVGFSLGYFLSPQEVDQSNNFVGQAAVDDSVERAATLEEMYESNPELGKLKPAELEQLVEMYLSDPDNWDDAMVPEQFVKLLSEARSEEIGGVRRLRSADRLENYRALAKDFDEPLVRRAFGYTRRGFPDPVKYKDDKISVFMEGNECVITSEESNSLQDWINNLDLGNDDILSYEKYNQRDKSCGCDKKTLWWCSRYKSCPVHVTLGSGFDGFVKPWNAMRIAVVNQIKTKCSNANQFVFAGYSRGGAILAIASSALKKEGVLNASKIKLVTYGAPRALNKGFSDETHNDFVTWRMVYKKDPVPSLPYGWMGYRHFGNMVCNSCGYPEERDRPNFSWVTDAGDHTGYKNWFN